LATVEILLSPTPVHVRTARLVGVAAARRAGMADDLVDELRLALGEACSRAVALNAAHAPDVPVKVQLHDDPTGLTVAVTDCGPGTELAVEGDGFEDLGDEGVDPQVALAVLAGLVDELAVDNGPDGTTVTMRWPLEPGAL
jgi:anti-sigma regulatory factor (Ser/Thr protein kinase)